jgi:Fic family protein
MENFKSGVYVNQGYYKAFMPNPISRQWQIGDMGLLSMLIETIHHFLDGNGRIGRLMIPLYLVERNILKRPILYLSDFFEKHRDMYYDNLMSARKNNDIKQWFKFFLSGAITMADTAAQTFESILRLRGETDRLIVGVGRRMANAKKVMNALFETPVIAVERIMSITGCSKVSSLKLFNDLERLGIVDRTQGRSRRHYYYFYKYIRLFNK